MVLLLYVWEAAKGPTQILCQGNSQNRKLKRDDAIDSSDQSESEYSDILPLLTVT